MLYHFKRVEGGETATSSTSAFAPATTCDLHISLAAVSLDANIFLIQLAS